MAVQLDTSRDVLVMIGEIVAFNRPAGKTQPTAR